MGFPVKLFAKPAMVLVGKLLQKLDKNDTGFDDEVGKKLEELGRGGSLDGLIETLDADGRLDEDEVKVTIH